MRKILGWTVAAISLVVLIAVVGVVVSLAGVYLLLVLFAAVAVAVPMRVLHSVYEQFAPDRPDRHRAGGGDPDRVRGSDPPLKTSEGMLLPGRRVLRGRRDDE